MINLRQTAQKDLVGIKRVPLILHVCESLPGGPAGYLNELIPLQQEEFGKENVLLLVPEQHKCHLDVGLHAFAYTYRRMGRGPVDLFRLGATLWKVVRKVRPDLVHFHSSFAGGIGRLVLRLFSVPPKVVYCAHGWAIDPGRASTFRWLLVIVEKFLAKLTDCILNISPHEQEMLVQLDFPLSKMRTVTTGISNHQSHKTGSEHGPELTGQINLLFVGRLDKQKGLDKLIDEICAPGCRHVHLTVAGQNVVGMSKECPPNENVTFLGWVSRSEIPELMRLADAVVMPSRWEGMPLVALEAMRASRALFCSNMGPFPYLVEDMRTGVIMDTTKPGFLSVALKGLCAADLHRMGEFAREKFNREFTSERMHREIAGIYSDLIGHNPEGDETTGTDRLKPSTQ